MVSKQERASEDNMDYILMLILPQTTMMQPSRRWRLATSDGTQRCVAKGGGGEGRKGGWSLFVRMTMVMQLLLRREEL